MLPGERLTGETLDYIADSVAHGGQVRGRRRPEPADDPGGARAMSPASSGAWGVDSEYGRLLDVLLCPPDNFRWLPTSAISKATLESGRRFDPELAARASTRELVSAYEAAGVRVPLPRARPGAALPGVRARLERR